VSELGIVAIGRNEGERLHRCLASLGGRDLEIVYVDSGSTDSSVGLARMMDIEVVELDRSAPFSAARARNAGFERLREIAPGVRFVQFLDGDCEVADGWLDRARRELETRPELAVVFGLRRERFPEHSIYNRLADLEWNTLAGEADACGGDAMMRADAFEAAGGYNPTLPAGEEPELCQRLRQRGWKIWRIDADMTWHDLDMRRFHQWWKRQVRSGYSGLDVAVRFSSGRQGLFRRQIRSARIWAVGWTSTVIAAGTLGTLWRGPAAGAAAAALLALALPAQMFRLAWRARHQVGTRVALAHGMLTLVAKWGHLIGQLHYFRDRITGHHARLIEYKGPCPRTVQAAPTP
jgi:glycosyltransferase involved in cell wall biosynthesis